ncbi:MAG: hypothetical protein R3C32_15490 [Chloroflexota bacterium]
MLVAYAVGVLFTMVAAGTRRRRRTAAGWHGRRGQALEVAALGTFVLLQRATIGYAVAVLTRSQVAGVVVGIILYLGESILATILTVMSLGRLPRAAGSPSRTPSGTSTCRSASATASSPPRSSLPSDLSEALLRPVPLEQAVVVTGVYLVVALAIASLATERAEIA